MSDTHHPRSEMDSFTEAGDGIPAPAGEVPVVQSYIDTLNALDVAKIHLDKSSRSLLNCFSSAESSNPKFIHARSRLADLATVYMDMHFPLSVTVVRDLRNIFYLYTDFDMKKFKKSIGAMEKSVSEQAKNSAMLSRVHGLLLSDLERLHLDTGKILDSIEREAAEKREDYIRLLENAQLEKEKFYTKKQNYDADKERYDKERLWHDAEKERHYGEKKWFDAEKAKYVAEQERHKAAQERHKANQERFKADEKKYDDEAHGMRREGESAGLRGVAGLVTSGVGVALGAGALLIAAPVAVVVGGVGVVVTGAVVAVGGIHGQKVAQGSVNEAAAKKRSAIAEGASAAQMSESAMAHEERAIARKEEAIANGEKAIANGEKAIANGEKAIANREQAIANGEKATANAERAAANAEKALRDGKRAADQATHDAKECDKAVQLIKDEMIKSLTLFIKAMEKVTEFLSTLQTDTEVCLKEVRNGISGRMKDHLSLIQIYKTRIIAACDLYEGFRTVVQGRVDALPILNGNDAAASSKDWCERHMASGKLQQDESREILFILFPAQFPLIKLTQTSRWQLLTVLKRLGLQPKP